MARSNIDVATMILVLASLASPEAVLGQPSIKVGPEFQVNSYTTDQQRIPAVAADGDSDFVVVWVSDGQDSDEGGVFGRRFNSAGVAQATEFLISTHTVGEQGYPAVDASTDGGFVVAWNDIYVSGGSIFARRFDSAGTELGAEFQVNALNPTSQAIPALSVNGPGAFVIAWQSDDQDGDQLGVFARRFDAGGIAQATEFQVSSYTVGYQRSAAVALDDGGDFVVAWQSDGQDSSGAGIFARRFNAVGTAQAVELQVNSYTTGDQRLPCLAADADGDFVVVWASINQDGPSSGVFARRFDSAGVAQAAEFQVSTYTVSSQYAPAVTSDDDGDFVVAWHGFGGAGIEYGIFSRRFDSSGVAQATQFQVDSYTGGYQSFAAVTAGADGELVVAWQSYGQDGDNFGVFAQRFAVSAILDVDGNGTLGALTDGLLVLRFLFNFTGPTLTNAAVGPSCSRCDAAAIQPYLSGLGLVLDIDGNGSLGALSDGLLVLRFLFGFTGTTLTNGATTQNCTRCDAAAILPYLQTLD